MTVSELIRELREIVLVDPDVANLEIIAEERETWAGYHLSPGFAKRGQHGKPYKVVWRQE